MISCNSFPQPKTIAGSSKARRFLERSNKNEFLKELSKQVSAFANSGGGNIVFGLSDSKSVEPCEQTVGRQPMKDYLATTVEQSVEYPLRHFKVHRIPVTGDDFKSVLSLRSSTAQRHLIKRRRTKFTITELMGTRRPRRISTLSYFASAETRSILEIGEPEFHIEKFIGTESALIEVLMVLPIRNVSFQSTASWGVLIEHTKGDDRWAIRPTSELLDEVRCFPGFPSPLLPHATTRLSVPLVGRAHHSSGALAGARDLWKHIALSFRPVTHNHVGQPVLFGNWPDKMRERLAMNEFDSRLQSAMPQN